MDLKISAAAACLATAVLATPSVAQPMNDGPWRGLYIGIGGNAGEAFGGNKLSFQDLSAAQDLTFQTSNPSNMFVGGLQLGQLWPMGGVVVGLESDVTFGKDIDYLSSARGIVGVPAGSFLIYGTGGVGLEIASENFTVTSANGEEDGFAGKQKFWGWAAGGGVQALVAPRLTLGVEAIHYDFGSDTTPLSTVLGGEPFNMIQQREFTVVRARLDFHFTNFW